MRLYIVTSETLYEKVPILDFGEGPLEPYCICELVLAETRGQARYIAWRESKHFESDLREMPNFRTRLLMKGFKKQEPGIVSDKPGFNRFWNHTMVTGLFKECAKW